MKSDKPINYASEPWFPSQNDAFTLFAAITHDCNLKCSHCFAANDGEHSISLSDKQWFALFDQLSELENPRLFFTGGEPLKHKSFIKFATYSVKKSIPVILATNATTITPSISKELFSIGINDVRVSIDGSCAEIHDKLRGDGAFELAKNGTTLLLSEGMNVSVRTTVNKLNFDELEKIADFIVGLGINLWEIKHIIPAGRAHTSGLLTLPKDRINALNSVEKIYKFGSYPNLEIKLMEGILHPCANICEGIKIASCPAGARMMVVQPTGDVIPCGYLASSVIGNITKMSLKEIRQKWSEKDKFQLPACCKDCKHKELCGGGCPAYNFCDESVMCD